MPLSSGVFFSNVVHFEKSKMALKDLGRLCLKSTVDFNLNRSGNYTSCLVKLRKYSTPAQRNKDSPVKYTANKASKISISENLEIVVKDDRPWFQPYVVIASLVSFLVYFCILREENDIDEILKGNPEYRDDYTNYIDLQLKLAYCVQNNLPTEGLKAKIEEYREILSAKS